MGWGSILAVGIVVGVIWANIVYRFFLVGVLHVVDSDPEDGPHIFLELSKNMEAVTHKTYVLLKVATKNRMSRK